MTEETKGLGMPFSNGSAFVHTDRFGCVTGKGEVYWHPAHCEPPSEEEALQRMLGALRWARNKRSGVEVEVIEVKTCGDCPWFQPWIDKCDGGCGHPRTVRHEDEYCHFSAVPPAGCGQRQRDTHIVLAKEKP